MVEVSYDQLTFSFSVTFPDVLEYVKQPRWDRSHQSTRTGRLRGEYAKERKKTNKQKAQHCFHGLTWRVSSKNKNKEWL